MSIPEHTLQVLEFPAIRERLAGYAGFSLGRERALVLQPATDRGEVEVRLARTDQARDLLARQPSIGVGGAHDVRASVDVAARGYRLDPRALLLVQDQLRAVRQMQQALTDSRAELPLVWQLVAALDSCPALERRISASLDDDGRVLDGASAALAGIRVRLRQQRVNVQRVMQQVVRSRATARLLQDPIVTERNGRAVVPVKQEHRSEFRGVVHDASASGATLFMEPLAAVAPNNAVRELQIEEDHEIERILLEISGRVGAAGPAIAAGVEGLADLDLVVAMARLSNALDAQLPELDPADGFDLKQARHPLIDGVVVPIDIGLAPAGAEAYRAVVITGPNTGGKTVALKSVGLLHLMAAAGLHIPARLGSRVAVYRSVLADIGDEQSIEQSLSTFSSHLRNLVAMLAAAGPHTLVLADELGAGTDPAEGGALARAIVERLLDCGAAIVVTTHHPELKTLAIEHPQVRNASVEFDVDTLRPTYRMILGVPGRSNALAIAARLGLDADVIARARGHLDGGHADLEAVIAALQTQQEAAQRAERDAADLVRAAEERQAVLGARAAALEHERDEVLRAARREARELVAQARNALTEAGRAAQADDPARLPKARSRVRRARARLDPAPPATARATDPGPVITAPLTVRVGDRVLVDGLGSAAEVSAVGGRDIEVIVGGLRTRVPRRAIRDIVPRPPAAPPPRPTAPRAGGSALEVDVRGHRGHDMPRLVDDALDRAVLQAAAVVRIIHGKGTGALRRAVQEHLQDHPAVAAHESAPLNEGGDGVTVIRLVEA